jgi:oligoribonuclease NrnB/cAMP/cGMP phosphodiesterase (DHH superfamily)
MIGIYHSKDLDGIASGVIMKLKYPDIKLVGYDYGQELEVNVDEPIIMADVSLPMKNMLDLAKISKWNFTWIDHHISSINEYNSYIGDGESFCVAVLDTTKSACELTWNYIFPDEKLPKAIKLLSDYDIFNKTDLDYWKNEVMPFQMGMRTECSNVDDFPLKVLNEYNQLWTDIIEIGKTIIKYQENIDRYHTKNNSFCYNFEGYRAICLNSQFSNTQIFTDIYNEELHDLMIPFFFDGKQWKFSLYTSKPDVDCTLLAKKYGGGGHRQASGFIVSDIKSVFPSIS